MECANIHRPAEASLIEGKIYVVYWEGVSAGGYEWFPKAEGAINDYRETVASGCPSVTLLEHTLAKPITPESIIEYLDDIDGVVNESFVIAKHDTRWHGTMIISGYGEELPVHIKYLPIEDRDFSDEWDEVAAEIYESHNTDDHNAVARAVDLMGSKGWRIKVSEVNVDVHLG